jgi:WD domain, G-beta repeat
VANRLAHTITLDGFPNAFAFSDDGRLLAAAGATPGPLGPNDPNTPGQITLFDTATGRQLARIVGHPRMVAAVAFSPDGRCLASADFNNLLDPDELMGKRVTFRYWEVATLKERHRFKGHLGGVHSLAFSPSGSLLTTASPDAPIYVWDVYGRQSQPAKPWTAAEGEQVWQALGNNDASVGFDTLRRLIRSPGPAVALIRGRLKRAEPIDARRVKQWLADLDADDFTKRQAAFTALEQLGDRIETPLRQALAEELNLETKRRVESLLAKLDATTPDRLANGRALEALEQTATPEALRLLDDLAHGDAAARLTREAVVARERIKHRESR